MEVIGMMISKLVPFLQQIGHSKHHELPVIERDIDQKMKLLHRRKDDLQEAMVVEILNLGEECQTWIDQGEELVLKADNMLRSRQKDPVVLVSFVKQLVMHLDQGQRVVSLSPPESETTRWPKRRTPHSKKARRNTSRSKAAETNATRNKMAKPEAEVAPKASSKPDRKASETQTVKPEARVVRQRSKAKAERMATEIEMAKSEAPVEAESAAQSSTKRALVPGETHSLTLPDLASSSATAKDHEVSELQQTKPLTGHIKDVEVERSSVQGQSMHEVEGDIDGQSAVKVDMPSVQIGPRTDEIWEEDDPLSIRLPAQSTSPAAVVGSFPNTGEVTIQPTSGNKAHVLPAREDIASTSESNGEQLMSPRPRISSWTTPNAMRKLRSLENAGAKKIGIYGQGGIGKTSMLKARRDDSEAGRRFDLIIWVTVSRCWSVRKIQNEIARKLEVSQAESESDKDMARKLLLALREKKFLLLLDDVWEKIDLDAVGVPDPGATRGCRIIMTTRWREVCHDMGAKEIEVEGLPKEEAWKLFQEHAGQIVDCPQINPYARAVVEECGGLPLTIIVTGKALVGEKDYQVWKRASKDFLLPRQVVIQGTECQMQQLTFSYERLNDRVKNSRRLRACDIQTCFLYCALVPEDREINRNMLVEYWIQEGLIVGKSEDAPQQGHDIVQALVDAALLESTDDGLGIKMHNTIRDLASGILMAQAQNYMFPVRRYSRLRQLPTQGRSLMSGCAESNGRFQFLNPEGHQLLFSAGAGRTEPPPEDEWKQAKMIFLMDNQLSRLPENPNCPHLLALFLQRNDRLRAIPQSFFACMPSLTVLDLSNTRITSLPLLQLAELKQLILRNCERLARLPSEIGALKNLELLDLHETDIEELPAEIGKLKYLSYLEVYFYGPVDHREYSKLPSVLIPPGILSMLKALRNLSIAVYPGDERWNKTVQSVVGEVCQLSNLSGLSFYFPKEKHLELFLANSQSWKANKLKIFNFDVGHDIKRMVYRVPQNVELDYRQQDHCLRFVNEETVPDTVKKVVSRTAAFYLDHHIKVGSLSEFGVRNLAGLEFCVLRECPMMNSIVGQSNELTLPILEHLSIHYLENLERIWVGSLPPGSFAGLRYLCLQACPKLKYVVKSSTTSSLGNLGELVVEACRDIKTIIFKDTEVDAKKVLLPELKKLTLRHLPNLVSVWEGLWPSLEDRSIYNCPKLNDRLAFNSKQLKKEVENLRLQP